MTDSPDERHSPPTRRVDVVGLFAVLVTFAVLLLAVGGLGLVVYSHWTEREHWRQELERAREAYEADAEQWLQKQQEFED